MNNVIVYNCPNFLGKAHSLHNQIRISIQFALYGWKNITYYRLFEWRCMYLLLFSTPILVDYYLNFFMKKYFV